MPTPSAEPLLRSNRRQSQSKCLLVTGIAFLAGAVLVLILIFTFKSKESEKAITWPPPSPSVMGSFDRFAITTDNTLCAHAGKSVIAAGGNAVEAAVAAMFCLGATNPQSSGLGGGFLMTLYNASTGQCTAIDAREEAPQRAHKNMFVNNSEAGNYGFLAPAVPGELAGFWEVYRRFGSGAVKWEQLVQPTIDLLEGGLPVTAYLAQVMKGFESRFLRTPSMKLWIDPVTNQTYAERQRIPRERLLRTLKKIATSADPVQLFYKGEFAEVINREMEANGGLIRKADLAAYRVRVHNSPLVSPFKNGLAMCGGPPPSGFAVTQLIVNLMNKLYPNSTAEQLRTDPKIYHHFIESQKFAYALRSQLGDAKFVPLAGPLAERMLTPAFLDTVMKKMSDQAQESSYYGGDSRASTADFGTSHVSVLDDEGNGVSATTTINRRFGAVVESEALGIVWNDEMGDFSTPGVANGYGLAPSEMNFITPGKRPMSSMSPLVVYDKQEKKVRMVAGASGGSMIISATSKTVIRSLIFGETIKEAIDAPLLHNQFTPDMTMTGQDFPEDLKTVLERDFGQKLRNVSFQGISQAIVVNKEGKINACGDARRKTDQMPAGV